MNFALILGLSGIIVLTSTIVIIEPFKSTEDILELPSTEELLEFPILSLPEAEATSHNKQELVLLFVVNRNSDELQKAQTITDEIATYPKANVGEQTTTTRVDPGNSNQALVESTIVFNSNHEAFVDFANLLLDNHRTNGFYDNLLPGSIVTIEDLGTGFVDTIWAVA